MVDLSKFTFNKKILNNFVTKLCSIISFHEFFTYIRHQRWIQCFLKKKRWVQWSHFLLSGFGPYNEVAIYLI